MHALSAARMAAFVGTDDAPLTEWRADAADIYRAVAADVPASDRPAIETFLATEPPPATTGLVFSHNDLGIEHVLVEPGAGVVTGIIDWSDAAMVDRRTTSGCSIATSARSRSTRCCVPGSARTMMGCANEPSSTRAAACWRISPTAAIPDTRSMSTRVSPHSAGCSRNSPRVRH
jgi:aminoglycoside phosphotransferase (APT) family kinase protein